MTSYPDSPRGPQPVSPGGAVSAADRRADEWARQAVAERLPRLRALATAWGATVTAITAVFGLAAIPDSGEIVRKLESPFPVLFGLTALLAVVAASASILLASLAAQPSEKSVPPDLGGRITLYDQTMAGVTDRLNHSRWAAGVAVFLLVLNVAIRWYAPQS